MRLKRERTESDFLCSTKMFKSIFLVGTWKQIKDLNIFLNGVLRIITRIFVEYLNIFVKSLEFENCFIL